MRRAPDPSTKAGAAVRYRYPVELTPEEQAQVLRLRVVDADAYLEWLETGEGPEPCAPSG